MHICAAIYLIFSILVSSFVELVNYFVELPDFKGKYVLSERLSQDPIENYFGQLRSKGRRCQNPSVSDCITSAQSIRVQRSMSMMPVRGNCARKKRLFPDGKENIDDAPLPKRRCARKKQIVK